ncbi:MAG: sodium:solute symporter family protein [Polyangiaceae bacterium]
MKGLQLGGIDYIILTVYFVFVLGIGWMLRRSQKTSEDFFLSGRSIPTWVAGLAFLCANLGAQEMVGMAASGAKYGIATAHFYWIGAIPAMVFVAVFMMPFYYGSRARSVPEYLKLRFDEKTRGLNALSFAAMTVFSSGISMYALARLLELVLGWRFDVSLWTSGLIVLAYIYLGGLTSAIYNEVLQFFLIVLGFAPLVYLGMRDVGGWSGLAHKLSAVAIVNGYPADAYYRAWAPLQHASSNPMGVQRPELVMGIGFVLSFGYWCTDFLVIQRAMAARSMAAARRAPLIAAVPKMAFPFLIILPGMIAIALTAGQDHALLPRMPDGSPDFTMVIPAMLERYFPNGLLGLGLTALMASFMSGMAGNVTAFNTVFTYDIYQTHIRKDASDAHLLWVGRMTTIAGVIASAGTAYLAAHFNNIMDLLQLVFAFVNAPLFATFLLGMFWKRTTGHGAFGGLLLGTVAAALHHGLTVPAGAPSGIKGGWLVASPVRVYPSEMALSFWTAIFAWSACFTCTIVLSLLTRQQKSDEELKGLVYSLTSHEREEHVPWWKTPEGLGALVIVLAVTLNIVFW